MAALQCRYDTRAVRLIAKTDIKLGVSFQPALQAFSRTENQRFDERHSQLIQSSLPLKQRCQFLGFQVGSEEGVVDDFLLPITMPGPGMGVAGQCAGIAFDFDQEEALRSKHQQVNFVDAAIVGNELKIRPGSVWLMGGKL